VIRVHAEALTRAHYALGVIVWLNGPFGAGKTTTANELLRALPDGRYFDPEQVGFMLRHALMSEPVGDFQDWPPWRALVVETARVLLAHAGGTLVAPQTVLVERYWHEIKSGLHDAGISVRHVVLHVALPELVRRIEADVLESAAKQWRLDHVEAYQAARSWLDRDAEIVDITSTSPADVARMLVSADGRP
jgi:hypothetical protein